MHPPRCCYSACISSTLSYPAHEQLKLSMKKWLKWLGLDLAALFLGTALTFAFAPYEIFPLAVLAPAGLLALWLNVSPKRAFWLGFLFGAGLFGAGVYWVFISIHDIGGVPSPLAALITAGMIAILALYPGAVGYLTNRYFPVNHTAKLICAFPAIWVFSEWVRSWLFTGFPWLFLGYSQTNSPLKGYAPILSVYGVSLAVAITSALIVNIVIQFKQKKYQALYFSVFGIVAIWCTGSLLSYIPWTKSQGQPLSISLVQGNIAQSIKWSPEHLQLSLDTYEQLTESLWGPNKLIIWPESAIPMPLQSAREFVEMLDTKAKATDSHLILGIPIEAADKRTYYNAVVTLGKDKQVYLKRRLVPFGEYTPFSQLFTNLFKFMDIPMSDLVPGRYDQTPIKIGNNKILTAICYEIGYPELVNINDKTISLILTVTNDAWFGESNAEAQHLQMAQMRAIELARPVVFVSNDGITGIIHPSGKIESALPQRQAGVLNGSVQPMYGLTPWMRNGLDPLLFILICLLITAVRANFRQKKDRQADIQSAKQITIHS